MYKHRSKKEVKIVQKKFKGATMIVHKMYKHGNCQVICHDIQRVNGLTQMHTRKWNYIYTRGTKFSMKKLTKCTCRDGPVKEKDQHRDENIRLPYYGKLAKKEDKRQLCIVHCVKLSRSIRFIVFAVWTHDQSQRVSTQNGYSRSTGYW